MPQDPTAPPKPEFGRIRSFFWPIHRYELKKLLPMLLIFFFISLVYSLLRNTKDTLVVTAPGGGAGLIPFLKVYGVIPGSILVMIAYSKLNHHFGKKRAFIGSIGFFMAFFLVFALVFPVRDALEPVAWAERMQAWMPVGLLNLVAMVRHWVLALFYIMSELWGSVALSLLFWGFANDTTHVEESKRFYSLFGVGANLALVAVKFVNQFTHMAERQLQAWFQTTSWNAYIFCLMGVVILSGAAILGLYLWMNQVVLRDPRFAASVDKAAYVKPKVSLSLKESILFLARSRHLCFIAVLVMSYGVAINLIEVTWKNQLGLRYPNPSQYQDFMANFSMATGITTIILMLFVSSNVIRRFGWTVAALVTPVVLLITGMGFFGTILFPALFAPLLAGFGTTPRAAGVNLGAAQNVMSKSSKYSLFDPTKEMAYIPLDQESKVKGKAAIDVVGARFGKALGSLIQQVLIALGGSISAITAPVAVILFGIIGVWIWAAVGLGKEFGKATRQA